ncbi:A/G-specific adenine glycosylase [Flavobacteriaceae bacterium]|nr:A/G-specific adenine glycosylase [Flavobacteriaceae bacterium]
MIEPFPELSKRLIYWYLKNKRTMPWRGSRNPYLIWLSEIMLQQTQVSQGTPYYEAFVANYPDVGALAHATEEEVLKLWQGLGYYSRARNLHATAKKVVSEYHGVFPATYKGLLGLPGIGDYTASAIASICYDLPTAVVDGNVFRVLSRIFGIDEPINTPKGARLFKALAHELLDVNRPGEHNQALMEFGALQCKPKNPSCTSCPLADICQAQAHGLVADLPVKLKKVKVTEHHFNFIVPLTAHGATTMELRSDKGIWPKLYQFPLVDSTISLTHETLLSSIDFLFITQDWQWSTMRRYNPEPYVHRLTHKKLFVTFWLLNEASFPGDLLHPEALKALPVPVIIERFISEFTPFRS